MTTNESAPDPTAGERRHLPGCILDADHGAGCVRQQWATEDPDAPWNQAERLPCGQHAYGPDARCVSCGFSDAPATPDAADASEPLTEAEREVTGRSLIDAERARQQRKGYSVHHDREHGPHDLFRAANCYQRCDRTGWPWADEDWKPRDLLSNLLRAGALFQAALAVADPAMDDASGWVGEKPKHIRRCRDTVADDIDRILQSPVVAAHEAAAATKARAEGHRDGYEMARSDMVSGAFTGGPTYEALRDSFTGQRIIMDERERIAQAIEALPGNYPRKRLSDWLAARDAEHEREVADLREQVAFLETELDADAKHADETEDES